MLLLYPVTSGNEVDEIFNFALELFRELFPSLHNLTIPLILLTRLLNHVCISPFACSR